MFRSLQQFKFIGDLAELAIDDREQVEPDVPHSSPPALRYSCILALNMHRMAVTQFRWAVTPYHERGGNADGFPTSGGPDLNPSNPHTFPRNGVR